MAKSDGSGLTGNGMADSKTGVGQDGFNHPSHVTNYGDGERTRPQVGRDKASATDKRGSGGTMGDE